MKKIILFFLYLAIMSSWRLNAMQEMSEDEKILRAQIMGAREFNLDVYYQILIEATQKGFMATLKEEFDRKPDLASYTDENKNNLLIIAAQNGQVDIVTFLLKEAKVDPNHVNAQGNTALHCSLERNDIEVIKVLLGFSLLENESEPLWICVNGTNALGKTPLQIAEESCSDEVKDLFKLASGLEFTGIFNFVTENFDVDLKDSDFEDDFE